MSRLLAVAANVGVVIGLVLVFVEVRQYAELTRTAMEQQDLAPASAKCHPAFPP